MTQPPATNLLTTRFNDWYLGKPGTMRLLRVPDAGVTTPASRAENAHDLLAGGVAVTRRPSTRRQWQVGFSGCPPETADLLVAFYTGLFGDGPFCWVDPAWRNALSLDASTFGARVGVITPWALSVSATQSLTVEAGVTPGTGFTSAVGRWASAQNGSRVGLGTWTGSVFTPNPLSAPPYLPEQVTTIRVYAQAVSGTPSVSLRGLAVSTTGVVASTTTTTATLSSATWTQLVVTVPAALTAAYVVPDVLCNTNSSVIRLSNADVQYGQNAPPLPWVTGLGVARVVFTSGLGSSYQMFIQRDHSVTLVEI